MRELILVNLLETKFKSSISFKYDINIKENIFNLDINDYLDLGIRNNNKRRFLFISKYLGKHLACSPKDMDKLGSYIVKAYEKKQDYLSSGVVISFAETGTALGHSVFEYIGSNYEFIHTTREVVDGKKTLDFLEEHSHATNHYLYYEDLEQFKEGEEIVLVDDEITTGNTCVNLIKKINSTYKKKRYTICSILNWMDENSFEKFKNLERELDTKISFVYLFSGDFRFDCNEEEIKNFIEENKTLTKCTKNKIDVNYIYFDMEKYNEKYLKHTARFGINKSDQRNLKKDVSRLSSKLDIKEDEEVLFLGTEEFMYIPMCFAMKFKNSRYHSTTRSPILEFDIDNYPIKTKFKHNSLYNEDIANYVYNIDRYNYKKCFLFCEINLDKSRFKEIIDIISSSNIKELNIVICKS